MVEQTVEGWYQAIKTLIDNKTLRDSIASAGLLDVRANHCNDVIAARWSTVLSSLAYNQEVKMKLVHLLPYKWGKFSRMLRFKMDRARHYYEYHGVAFAVRKAVWHVMGWDSR